MNIHRNSSSGISGRRNVPAQVWLCGVILAAALFAASPAGGQASLAQAGKLYVDQFSEGVEAAGLRQSLIRRIGKSGRFQVVDTPQSADAIVKGSGEVWVKGYVSINPRVPATERQAVYGGYLSVEVLSKSGEPLWSYLVTPSRLAWAKIRDDLANNLVREMLRASAEAATPTAVAPMAQQSLAKTNLTGSGATFPAPLYRKWFASFSRVHPEIHISYTESGSEAGTRALAAGEADFAASDLSTLDVGRAQIGAGFRRIASVLGGVVPAYNLSGSGRELRFTSAVLAGIYLGRIRKWNDSEIRNLNKDVDLPDAEIVVIHRSDGSGTTYAWSEFLSKTDPEWKNAMGTGTELKWPVGSGAEGNEKVATAVQGTPNSIGYVELVYAIEHRLSVGTVRNRAGSFIRADLDSLAEAAKAAALSPDAHSFSSIIDPPGKNAYPIATFTWFLLPPEIEDAAKKQALHELLRWILTTGQKECSSLGYAPLPAEVAARQLDFLQAAH